MYGLQASSVLVYLPRVIVVLVADVEVSAVTTFVGAVTVWSVQGWHTIMSKCTTLADSH